MRWEIAFDCSFCKEREKDVRRRAKSVAEKCGIVGIFLKRKYENQKPIQLVAASPSAWRKTWDGLPCSEFGKEKNPSVYLTLQNLVKSDF